MKSEENVKLITSKEVARIVGIAERTVQTLAKEGYLTYQKSGQYNRYNLYEVVQEYMSYQAQKEDRTFASLEEKKLHEETRLKKAKADVAELELNELRGNLHSAEDVEMITTDMVLFVRSGLLSLPGRLAVDVAEAKDAAEASEIIKNEVCNLLEELANYEYDPEEYRRRVRDRKGWMDDKESDRDSYGSG
ncbi:protoporphyrinogen oxidase [Lachnospiraceae bacterium]|jgi:phage terminase Nu1 subunit (DNA packaging protein)|nr:protoporphyrinogen oxidase [Lachnospiraceae bacterium]